MLAPPLRETLRELHGLLAEVGKLHDHDGLRDLITAQLRRGGWFARRESPRAYFLRGRRVEGRLDVYAAVHGAVLAIEIDQHVPRWKSIEKARRTPHAVRVFILRGMYPAATREALRPLDRWVVIDAYSGRVLDPYALLDDADERNRMRARAAA